MRAAKSSFITPLNICCHCCGLILAPFLCSSEKKVEMALLCTEYRWSEKSTLRLASDSNHTASWSG